MTDVAIAGGGVAGSALAILLGRAGLQVELFEQHRFPREKACAEGLMPAGVAVLDRLGLAGAIGGARFDGIQYHGFGVEIATPFPAAPGVPAFGLGQRRVRLDATLFSEAAATAGVRVHEGTPVEGTIIDDDRVGGLLVDGREVRARLVVAADGPRSLVRRKSGLDGSRASRPRVGLRAHFKLAADVPAPSLVDVFVGEGHEIYMTPLPDREVSVAALAESGDGNVREHFARWLGLHPTLAARLEGAQQISELAGQMPLESRARRGVRAGLVLLGDAAGFVDPITGAGMAQALVSAELLAQTIVRPSPTNEPTLDASLDVLEEFDRRRRARLRDGVLLTRLALTLARHPFVARQTLRLFRAEPALFGHLVGVAAGTRALLPG